MSVGTPQETFAGEFRVALRSALLTAPATTLYAGAGVVAGSDPARELLETDVKLRALLGPVVVVGVGEAPLLSFAAASLVP